MPTLISHHSPAAIVSKAPVRRSDIDVYLRVDASGAPTWVDEPEAATAFATMREATRAALRLPGALRAFALPRDVECVVHADSASQRDLH